MTSSCWLVTSKKWSDCKGSGFFRKLPLILIIIQVLVFFLGGVGKFAYRFITFSENLGSIQGDSGSPPYRRREAKMVGWLVVGLVGWWWVVGSNFFFFGWKKNRQVIWRSLNIPILPWKGWTYFFTIPLIKGHREVSGTHFCRGCGFVPVIHFRKHSAADATVLVSFRKRKSPKAIQTMTRL